jgi:hypothetical protein
VAASQAGERGEAAPAPPILHPACTRGRLMCDHLHETTSRYDADRKLLSFLLVCPVCEIEEIVQTIEYAPSFVAHAAPAAMPLAAGARN